MQNSTPKQSKQMLKHVLFFIGFLLFASLNAQDSKKITEVVLFQHALNESFLDPETSPLGAEDLHSFKNLDFFEIDTSFYILAEFVRTPYETPFLMPTTTDRQQVHVKYGEAYFELKGKQYKLNLYQDQELIKNPKYKDYLFLPFTDLTNGSSSYSGGRYIDMEIPVANKILIDFNKAYNPYCAYNGKYSCPVPPKENHLDTKIEAGVKDFK